MASLSFELTHASWCSLRNSRRLTDNKTFSVLLRISKVAMRRLRIFHTTFGRENSAQNGGGANCARYSMRYSMLHAWLPSKTRPDKAHITFRVENFGKFAPVRQSFQAAWFYYKSANGGFAPLHSLRCIHRAGLN